MMTGDWLVGGSAVEGIGLTGGLRLLCLQARYITTSTNIMMIIVCSGSVQAIGGRNDANVS